jgi:nucleoid-associated protein YgaU
MIRWSLGALAAIALLITACEQKQPEPTAHQENVQPLSEMDKQPPAPAVTDPYADPYASESMQPRDAGTPPPAAAPARSDQSLAPRRSTAAGANARMHTVQKGDTLYKLARQYYNDQSQWKKIYEANRNKIRNQNQLVVGTELVIP